MPTRFDSMNRDELRAACRVAKITGYSKMTLGEMRARLWDVEPLEFALVRPSRDAQAYESFAVVASPDFAALESAGTLVHRFTAQNRSNITLRLEAGEIVVVVDNMLVHRTSVADWAWLEERVQQHQEVVSTTGGQTLEVTPITRRHVCQNTLRLDSSARSRNRGRKRAVPSSERTKGRIERSVRREVERQAKAAQDPDVRMFVSGDGKSTAWAM